MWRTRVFPFLSGGLTALVGVLLLAPALQAAPLKSDSKVKVTATADKPDADGKQVISVTLVVDAGWHLYANPVGNDDLLDSQTVVTVAAKGKALDARIDYPEGKFLEKDKCRIYEGKVTIKATVRRPKDDTSPLEVSVKLQTCDSSSCLLPAVAKVTVP